MNIKNRILYSLAIFIGLALTLSSCKKNDAPQTKTLEQQVEENLDAFVADLESQPPTAEDISTRVYAYMQGNPEVFFGSTVVLLDGTQTAVVGPYWYRSSGTLVESDLMNIGYQINEQHWLREVIDGGQAIWTEPYFDDGGGNILMKTRSVPVFVNGQMVAVATTDLSLE
jgi:sigma-B regulation protein RsbU (phosphoserine phosphatase)